MQTREMRELPKEVRLGYREHKVKGLPERIAERDMKKAKIRELQDEVNKDNRLIIRDTNAAIRIEQVCVEAGELTLEECLFYGKVKEDTEGEKGEAAPASAE